MEFQLLTKMPWMLSQPIFRINIKKVKRRSHEYELPFLLFLVWQRLQIIKKYYFLYCNHVVKVYTMSERLILLLLSDYLGGLQ